MQFPKGNDWTAQKAEIEAEIEALRTKLETADSWELVLRTQGAILSFRAIIGAAEVVLRDGKGSAKY